MLEQLSKIADRYNQINEFLNNPDNFNSTSQIQSLSKEQAELSHLVKIYNDLLKAENNRVECQHLLDSSKDNEMKELALTELEQSKQEIQSLEYKAKILLIPKDPRDSKDVILEIRSGTGGEEASLFVGDLFRLYRKYAELRGWRFEIIEVVPTGLGGFKEVKVLIRGKNSYSYLKYEAGTHRVQRVPLTESQGRIHTSAVTVAVMAEADEVDIEINNSDLRVDTYRSQGAGGQHVNTTDSAVRVTHVPSSTVVSCQDERSQNLNKAKALKYLRAKLYEQKIKEQTMQEDMLRKKMIGTGDRSARIRTYNYPQGRISDHRIKLTSYKLEEILQSGDIQEFVDTLLAYYEAKKIEELSL